MVNTPPEEGQSGVLEEHGARHTIQYSDEEGFPQQLIFYSVTSVRNG